MNYDGPTSTAYEEKYELYLGAFWGMQQTRKRTIHDIYNALDAISKKLS